MACPPVLACPLFRMHVYVGGTEMALAELKMLVV